MTEPTANHTSGMVALWPADPGLIASDLPGALPVPEMHVTLAFLGKAADLEPDLVAAIRSAVADTAAASVGPFDVEVTRAELLGKDDATVMFLDGPMLQPLYDTLWAALGAWATRLPDQFIPWQPHMTLGYGATGSEKAALLAEAKSWVGERIEINAVGVALADKVHKIEFGSTTFATVSRVEMVDDDDDIDGLDDEIDELLESVGYAEPDAGTETAALAAAPAAPGALTPREELLHQLGELHAQHSTHADQAPPAPDRKDGGVWNLDYHSPPDLEEAFMTAAAKLFSPDA